MKSIDPRDYAAQPQLDPPAGYICVLRDVDSDRWRIEGARHPKGLVESVLDESESRFGIEIVSMLETEDLAASAATLYERHRAGLGESWLELDEYQLETLRRSILQIDARPSYYLSPPTVAEARPTAAVNTGRSGRRSASRRRDRWGLRRGEPARQPLDRMYGTKALKNYKEPEPRDWREDLNSLDRWLLGTSERLARFRESDAGKALQVVLFLILLALMCLTDSFG